MALVRRTSTARNTPVVADPTTLTAALTGVDQECRRRAAVDLAGCVEAIPELLSRVPAETDPVVLDAVLTTLAAHDLPEVAAGLVGYLRSDDPALRTAVVEALAAMPRATTPLLAQLAVDPDKDVRILTAMVLADLPGQRALDWLIEMVSADRHPHVVGAALDALRPMLPAAQRQLLDQSRARFSDDPFLAFTIDSVLPSLSEAAK
jgi:HEAT repeat protein